jgi:hypothetical protein
LSSPDYAKLRSTVAKSEKRLAFIPPQQIKYILRTYFAHELTTLYQAENWGHPDFIKFVESELTTPEYEGVSKPVPPKGLDPSTNTEIMDRVFWSDIHAIIMKFAEMSVAVSGVRYPGRYVYVLACWCGNENPHAGENQKYPIPTDAHIASAIKAFIKELQELL